MGGYFAEVGVYKGGSLKHLAVSSPDSVILGFDTFEGLPGNQWILTDGHRPGEFSDTSLEGVYEFLKDHNNHVRLVKGIFPDSADFAKDFIFSFVHIDTDFYLSVKASIEWFWPRLLPGGIIVFDDYLWPACPGVQQALDESGISYQPTTAAFQAYIRKAL